MLLGKPHCAVGLVLALAVVMGDIDVDFAAPRRPCKMDLISPGPLISLYFQAVEWLCAQIVTEIKSVQFI